MKVIVIGDSGSIASEVAYNRGDKELVYWRLWVSRENSTSETPQQRWDGKLPKSVRSQNKQL